MRTQLGQGAAQWQKGRDPQAQPAAVAQPAAAPLPQAQQQQHQHHAQATELTPQQAAEIQKRREEEGWIAEFQVLGPRKANWCGFWIHQTKTKDTWSQCATTGQWYILVGPDPCFNVYDPDTHKWVTHSDWDKMGGHTQAQLGQQQGLQPQLTPPQPQLPQQQHPQPQPRPGQSGLESWQDTPFFTNYLADQRTALTNANVQYDKARSARGAMVLACTTLLYKYLPLLHDCFNDGLKDLLGVPDALFVTAEAIPRVEDGNRPGQFRVDFFAYMKSGDVHRYHPGSSPSQSATPHVMRMDSNLFQVDCATATGVGRALHLVAPGFASASSRGNGNDVAAFTPVHLQEVSIYDRQRNASWRLLQQAVTRAAAQIPAGTNELNVTDGEFFHGGSQSQTVIMPL